MDFYIAVCDDDKIVLDEEAALIEEVLKEKEMEYFIDKFSSPYELLNSDTIYNMIFLDIEMDKLNGISLAEKIRVANRNCLFFFVTNYEAYIDNAFNVQPFRFWVKPIDRHRLVYGIDSAIQELHKNNQCICVTVNNENVKIFINNIIYIYARNRKTHIVTTKGDIVINVTYQMLFEQIKKYKNFFETYRGYCINFNYVKRYDKDIIYCGYQNIKYDIYLSRRNKGRFQKRFSEWIGEK